MISRRRRVSSLLCVLAGGLVAATFASSASGCKPEPRDTAAEPTPPITLPSTIGTDHAPPPRQTEP